MRRSSLRVVIAAAAVFLAFAAADALAEIRIEAHYGFDGSVVPGAPAPITLRIENVSGEPLQAYMEVTDESVLSFGGQLVERSLEVSPGSTRQISVLVPGNPDLHPIVYLSTRARRNFFAVTPDGEVVKAGSRRFRMSLGEPRAREESGAILVLGGKARQIAAALPAHAEDRRLELDGEAVRALTLREDLAPDTWLAYSGFDTVIWTEPDLALLPDPAQLRALRDWVQFGGRLEILSASRPLLLDDPELQSLLPASSVDLVMERYPAPPGLGVDAFQGDGAVLLVEPKSGARAARVDPLSSADWLQDLPAPLECRIGEGAVVLARFDPLRYDLGDPQSLAEAVAHATGDDLRYVRQGDQPQWIGLFGAGGGGNAFFDLLTNENVLTPPIGLFFLLAILFVLLIGPINYHLLKSRNKLAWSPLTLLLYTVLYSGASVGATFVLFAPNEEVNRVAILDFTEGPDGEESVDGLLYHGAYSPYGGTYRVTVPGFQTFGQLASRWRGDYHYSSSSGAPQRRPPQTWIGPGEQPMSVRLPFNSLRVCEQRISGRPDGSVSVSIDENGERGVTLTVVNGLATPLRNAVLVTRYGVLELNSIAAGEAMTRDIESLDLAATSFRDYERLTETPFHPFQFEKRHRDRGESPPAELVRAILGTSVRSWLPAPDDVQNNNGQRMWQNNPDRGPAPWDMGSLPDDRAVFMAVADGLPFRDELAERPAGFSYVFVRRTVALPDSSG